MTDHACRVDSGAPSTWAEIMAGVPEPVGAVRACPVCGRTWVVYLSTSPISAWVWRAWRRERWWERLRRRHRLAVEYANETV